MEAVVCDAKTEDDLRAIAEAAAQLCQPAVFAGSAGLARHLPLAFGLAQKSESPLNLESIKIAIEEREPGTPESHRPLLFVVGSMSQVSREQLCNLLDQSGIRALTLSPTALRERPSSVAWRNTRRLLDEALSGSDDVALALGLDEGINPGEGAFLCSALAQLLLPLDRRLCGLFCTGGETARSLLNAGGAVGIRLVGEVEAGIPLGTVEGWHNLPIITKAGAFGSPRTLVHCRAVLQRFLRQTNRTNLLL